jgi:chromosome partitioning protein
MGKIYAIANRKGGVSKTTSCGALASATKRYGFKVLVCDLDPQGNITQWCGFDAADSNTTYEVIMQKCSAKEAIVDVGRYDLLPADSTLVRAESELMNVQGREFRLKEALDEVKEEYDLIFIDTPPNLGFLTIASFVAADGGVIVTSDTSLFATKGMGDLSKTLNDTAKYGNPNARVIGILLTRFNPRLKAMKTMREVTARFSEFFDAPVYDTFIRQSVGIMEAQIESKDLYDLPKLNVAIQDYAEFTKEFLIKEGLAEAVDFEDAEGQNV